MAAVQETLVWDAPVRVAHWALALSVAGAWLTAEAEGWRLLHITLGYTAGALVLLRLLWGVVGTRHARFVDFVRGPHAVLAYLQRLAAGRAPRYLGHNPAGAVVIVLLLGLGLLVPLSGWAMLNDLGAEALEELHELLAQAMLLLVGVHVAGVLLASWRHRDKLVAAMVTGRKRAEPGQPGIRWSWWPLGVLLLVGVLGFWLVQWRAAPQGGLVQPERVLASERASQDED